MSPLDLIPGWAKLAILAALASALVGLYAWRVHVERETGRAEIRVEWNADTVARQAVDLEQAQINARETLRRLNQQQENQHAQDQELQAARRDAARNSDAAGQLRTQLAETAQRWRAAFSDSAPGSDGAAAADAIGVLADVLGRADRRAGVLAAYADAARAAGLKCERDYDALTPPVSSTTERQSP